LFVRERTVPPNTMRILCYRSFAFLGAAVLLAFNGCVSNRGDLESRIESKLTTPDSGNARIGTETYNPYSRGFESPWPFGPYTD